LKKVSLNAENDELLSPLTLACQNGLVEVRIILSFGANVVVSHEQEDTPLKAAWLEKHEIVVRLLIRTGAAFEQIQGLPFPSLKFVFFFVLYFLLLLTGSNTRLIATLRSHKHKY
jgi:hypothetical protein